jgi:hypothetical protein
MLVTERASNLCSTEFIFHFLMCGWASSLTFGERLFFAQRIVRIRLLERTGIMIN